MQHSLNHPMHIHGSNRVSRVLYLSLTSINESIPVRYKEGGFHPVHLGDTFQNGRYTIIHKLGHGGFAVVWLARDAKQSRYVALKILAAHLSKECPEVEMLRRLRNGPAEGHVGKTYVMQLLHHFLD
jgi:serine/threonine-protein kinase SRPK3